MGRHTHPREGVAQKLRDRDAIQIARLLHHTKPGRSLKCADTPGKVRYKNLQSAKAEARRMRLISDAPQRPYRCPSCQGFHISSRPPKPGEEGVL